MLEESGGFGFHAQIDLQQRLLRKDQSEYFGKHPFSEYTVFMCFRRSMLGEKVRLNHTICDSEDDGPCCLFTGFI